MIDKLVLFGATGDLAGRYLMPALAHLLAAGELPDGFEVLGAAQQEQDDEAYRADVTRDLERHASEVAAAVREDLANRVRYRQVDVTDAGDVGEALHAGGSRPAALYLALPTGLVTDAVTAIGEAGLPEGSRIVVEKPFGTDLRSARELNALLARVAGNAGEDAIFRVDHFLGLAAVQNLLGLRLANRALRAVWSAEHIERVDIVWEETLGLEGRAAYYDGAGQLRDMVQNHLMQVLSIVAMAPREALDERPLSDDSLQVLRSARAVRSRRARYTAGRLDGRDVPAYVDEEGVDPSRNTETFAELDIELDDPRWAGAPFRLRTAKAMGEDRMEVVVRFRPIGDLPFGAKAAGRVSPDELRIGLAGDQHVTLSLTGVRAGPPPKPAPLALSARLPPDPVPEYGRVLLDILGGGTTLSIGAEAAEEAWRVVTPVLEAWADGSVALEEYPAGSAGPGA
jgi:glucose-6-phosphate 1-dehydrogenase